ncbi:MAG: Gfo/Idh/MocA family oxidoreductase, partial [Planctomycetota bacterium]
MPRNQSRRDFLKTSVALAGAQFLAAPTILADKSPNSKLGVAVVATGGMGGYSVRAGLNERVVAMVDVDEGKLREGLKAADKKGQKPDTYHDYRKMLDAQKGVDVVLIATPDHNHAPAAIRAIKRGKHVFVQKPMAHNIYECYALSKAAKENKVLTQMGNQGHCGENIRQVCEHIWAGSIGDVTETHSLLGRNFGGKGGRPKSKPVPGGLHWDEWLGPAPHREYHDGLHTFGWRSWRPFGTGTIGDMACHNVDTLFWALKIAEAKTYTVECLNTKNGSEERWTQDNVVRYEIPARAGMPPVTVYVYDHKGLRPDVMKEAETKHKFEFKECTLFSGKKGQLRIQGHSGRWNFLPSEKAKEIKTPDKTIARAHGGPIEDLFWAIKNDGTPCSNFPGAAGP